MHPAPVATSSIGFFSTHLRAHHGYGVLTYNFQTAHRLDLSFTFDKTDSRKDICFPHSPPMTLGPPQVTPIYLEAPIRDGLRTPPLDDMNSTASYPQQYSSYDNRKDDSYSNNSRSSHAAAVQLCPATAQPSRGSSGPNVPAVSVIRGASAPSYIQADSPQSVGTATLASDDVGRRKSIILPSLQIPPSINNSGGSLGEFAAQITCLFWFESTTTLRRAEEWTNASSPVKRLVPDAIPTVSFRKWVVTILSITQVTPNVILLALLFIYRLKTLNPTVKGKAGSEYRLLTVALMLGNKFLDDNTYTNKTWAEVSGISVGEIHVMEVEFLSNMRYSLLASKEQWEEWHVKLGRFSEFFERAAKAPSTLPSPLTMKPQSILPSPPTLIETSPTALSTYPPNSALYNYNQQWSANCANPLVAPLPSMPDLVPELNLQSLSRKRGYDESANEPPAREPAREPPAKKVTLSNPSQMAPQSIMPVHRQNLPRLPVPGLSVSTQMNGYPAIPQNLPLLPPLVGSRAMSTVYPSTPSWTPQSQASLTPTTSAIHSGTIYGTPSRRQSPRSVQDVRSMNSSPISGNFPTMSHNHNSPSFFLQQRSSPYRPVRLPNTLLYPPPSISMHNFPANTDQMHYQPLGKRKDYRAGVVPEYVAHPTYQNWSGLPQPNFQG